MTSRRAVDRKCGVRPRRETGTARGESIPASCVHVDDSRLMTRLRLEKEITQRYTAAVVSEE